MSHQDKIQEAQSIISLDNKYNSSENNSFEVSGAEGKKKRKFRWTVNTSNHPPEVFNYTLYLSVFVFGILGAARGLEEGNSGSNNSLASFKKTFHLNKGDRSADTITNITSNFTSFVLLGSIGGALIAMKTVDLLGRIRALQVVCIVLIVGVIVQYTSTTIGQTYAGKLIEGLAIGHTTSIGPVYLSEVAPSPIRGMATCIFSGAVYFGSMISYFANYGVALHVPAEINGHVNNNQWRYTLIPKLVLSALIFLLSFVWCVESPRWLVKVNKPDLAAKNLSTLRHLPQDHPYILAEISDINEQIIAEREATKDSSLLSNFKALFTNKSISYRFFCISAACQVIGQWTGASAVTIYASELFSLIGVTGSGTLKMSAVLGVVKFVSAYLSAFFLIDVIGRKRSLYAGLTLQLICMLYYAIFLTIVPEASETGVSLTGSKYRASQAALASIFLSGTGWTMGFNSVQYLIGAEIFPLGIRSFAQSLVMVLHFANQYGNSKAVPKMMKAMHPYGAFYFFVGVIAVALVYAFFLPELKGRSLESIEEVFETLPWYQLRNCNKLIPDHSQVHKIKYLSDEKGNTDYNHILYNTDTGKPTDEFLENIMDESKDPKENIENRV